MKFTVFPFIQQILFPLLFFALFGCDQDETPDYNYFILDDREYKIEECVIIKYFKDDTSGVFSIGFYYDLKFRDIDTSKNVLNIPIEENGVFLSDCLFSGNVEQGFYHVIDTTLGYGYNTIKKNCFYWGKIHFSIDEPEFRFYQEFTGGDLTIKTEGEKYIIQFNCAYEPYRTKKVTGYFSGIPREYNFKLKRNS